MKPGRKLRENVDRHRCGKIKAADRIPEQEPPEVACSVVVAQRQKFHGARGYDDAKDPWYGFPLGRYRKWAVDARCDAQGITDIQYRAIVEYIAVRHRYRRIVGLPSPDPKALRFGDVTGFSTTREPSDEEINQAKRQYNGARSWVEAGAGGGVEAMQVLDRLARDDESLGWKELGHARIGANLLARYFGVN